MSMSPGGDRIPALLRELRRSDRFRLVLDAGFAVLLFLWFHAIDLPVHWTFVAAYCAAWAVVRTNHYVKAVKRRPTVSSFMDTAIGFAWRFAKTSVILSAFQAAYVAYERGVGFALPTFLQQVFSIRTSLMAGSFNVIQAAWVLSLYPPMIDTLRDYGKARRFRKDLAPGATGKVLSSLQKAERLIDSGKGGASGLIDEASRVLRDLEIPSGEVSSHSERDLAIHRQLMREKIKKLRANLSQYGEDRKLFNEDTAALEKAGKKSGGPAGAPAGGGGAGGDGEKKKDADGGFGQYEDFVSSLLERSTVTWDDIAGLDKVVEDLKNSLALAFVQAPKGVDFDAPHRFLLYGPPGTGKTLLAACVSGTFGVPFFNVKVSDILSKYFGESPKLLSALFHFARKNSPSVIFFDEIESVSGDRDGKMDGEERRMLSTLLSEMDGLKSKKEKNTIFILAATNLPWSIDPAIMSRFERKYPVALPSGEARRRMIELHVLGRGYKLGVDMEKMVQYTRGYSGRELYHLSTAAIGAMIAECNPDMGKLIDRGMNKAGDYKAKIVPIGPKHLNEAFKKIRPQTDWEMLKRYEEWRQTNR